MYTCKSDEVETTREECYISVNIHIHTYLYTFIHLGMGFETGSGRCLQQEVGLAGIASRRG